MADHAPIWLMPCIRDALRNTGAGTVTFAQCALGAKARKCTTVAHASSLAAFVGRLQEARCEHGAGTHPEVAYGRDQAGRAMAAQSAAYPKGLNEALAEALTRAAESLARRTEEPAREQREHGAAGPQRGGWLAEEAALGGEVRAAVEAAREAPATFISARNLEP
eukprot:1091646-Pleurochrysis_carterae.AAC.1